LFITASNIKNRHTFISGEQCELSVIVVPFREQITLMGQAHIQSEPVTEECKIFQLRDLHFFLTDQKGAHIVPTPDTLTTNVGQIFQQS
jgi:hypothetical protein